MKSPSPRCRAGISFFLSIVPGLLAPDPRILFRRRKSTQKAASPLLGLDPDRKYHIYSKYLSYEAYGDELMQFGLMLEDQASGQVIEGSGGSGSCEDFRSLVYEVVGL